MTWRWWLAWAGVGSAIVLGCLDDWLASAGAAFGAALLAAWWVCGEMLAMRERMRVSAEMSAEIARCQAAARPVRGAGVVARSALPFDASP